MTETSSDRNPVELLAEEYVRRCRRGERPTLTEYAEQYPRWASDIRELFPTILMMENLKPGHEDVPEPAEVPLPEQLGDFRIVREIARGGMGIVYEAVQQSLGRRVALKVLSGSTTLNRKRLQRFKREAQTAAQLHHTNIVPVFGVGEQDGQHYYVMQYISGQGLDSILEVLREGTDRISGTVFDTHFDTQQDASLADASTRDAPSGLVSPASLALTLIEGRSHDTSRDGSASDAFARTTPASSGSESPSDCRSLSGPPDSERITEVVSGGSTPTGSRPASARSGSGEAQSGLSAGRTRGDGDRRMRQHSGRLGTPYWRSVAHIGMQVAGALEYAHEQGTLHRDIKPANLLLNEHGTVWVTDFGLAKLMEEEGLTNSGDVVGTLCYMAPEQFEGQADCRSDIYSLGLTLYELLTLEPAYDELDRRRLIRRITQEDPVPPRRRNVEIPRDLETIVQKAIARDPSHRYQSAAAFRQDLQCFLDDRPILARRISPAERLWRWCRRNRALAALSGLALSLLVLVAIVMSLSYAEIRTAYYQTSQALDRESEERRNADAERERAETTLQLTLQALDRVFHHIAPLNVGPTMDEQIDGTEVLLAPRVQPYVSEQDAALLQEMLAVYDQLAAQDRTTVAVQSRTASAYRRMGDIRRRLGQYPEAEDAFLRARTLYEQLIADSENQGVFQIELASIYNALGAIAQERREFAEARQWHGLAVTALDQRLSDSTRRHANSRYELARSLNLLALAEAYNYAASAAQRDLQRALDVVESLLAKDARNPEYRHMQAQCLKDMARLTRWGRGSSREELSQARDLLEALVKEHPYSPQYKYDLVDTYLSMTIQPEEDGEQMRIRQTLRRGLQLAADLTEQFPNVPEYQSLLARGHTRMGQFYRNIDEMEFAVAQFRTAAALHRALHDEFPTMARYCFDLAYVEQYLGQALCDLGELSEARLILEEALENQQLYQRLHPESRMSRWMLSRHHRTLAEVLALLGESTLAEASAQTAEKIRDELRQPRHRSGSRSRRSRTGPKRADDEPAPVQDQEQDSSADEC